MKLFLKFCLMALLSAAFAASSARLHAQASGIPSIGADQSGQDQSKHARELLDQMVAALGGDAWLNRKSALTHGHTASFFRGAPTLNVIDFWDYKQFPIGGLPELDRIEFTKKRDIVQIWTANNGYESTYKGNKPLPADQVKEYFQRQSHSVEAVVHVWLKEPGIVLLYEGTTMVERRMADKITLLGANNDAVTLELDYTSHLPLRRTYETRNAQFKDHDEDAEQYEDYHDVQGIPTAFSISRYHNGDLANQRFILNAEYGVPVPSDMFDTDQPLKHKK